MSLFGNKKPKYEDPVATAFNAFASIYMMAGLIIGGAIVLGLGVIGLVIWAIGRLVFQAW